MSPSSGGSRCPPLWGLLAGWAFATTLLVVLATRWVGWTREGITEAWFLVGSALAFLAAGALGLLHGLLGEVRAGRRVAESVRLRAAPPTPSLAAAAAEAGIRRCRLVVDPDPYAFTYGVLRPVVVVSSGLMATVGPGPMRAILLHEAAHARAQDPGRLMLARALSAGLLRLPPASRAENRVHQWIELAADRAALKRLGPRPVAAALLALLQRPESLSRQAGASVVEAGDLIPVRVVQLSSYPGKAVRPASTLRDRLVTAVLLAGLAAATVVPCRTFAHTLDSIRNTGVPFW